MRVVSRVPRPFSINKHSSILPKKYESTLVAVDFLAWFIYTLNGSNGQKFIKRIGEKVRIYLKQELSKTLDVV